MCRGEQESSPVEGYTTIPLISMMIRTGGSKRNNLSGYHIADPSAARMDDLVKKVGVDGSYEDEVVMGCVAWVGSQIRQHGDGDESQDDSGDSFSSSQQMFRIATQTAIGRTGGVHNSVLVVNKQIL